MATKPEDKPKSFIKKYMPEICAVAILATLIVLIAWSLW
jgi:hypothetical protein